MSSFAFNFAPDFIVKISCFFTNMAKNENLAPMFLMCLKVVALIWVSFFYKENVKL